MLYKRLRNGRRYIFLSVLVVALTVAIYSLVGAYAVDAPGLLPKKVEIIVDRPVSHPSPAVFTSWCGCIVEGKKACVRDGYGNRVCKANNLPKISENVTVLKMSVEVPKDLKPADLTVNNALYDATQNVWLPSQPISIHANWWVAITKEKRDELKEAGKELHKVGEQKLKLIVWYREH